MSLNYASIAATVKKTLTDLGKKMLLRKFSAGAYDPATGGNSVTSSDTAVVGVLFDYSSGRQMGPGGLIEAGDKEMIMEPGVAPDTSDKVVDGADVYAILGFQEINPAGTPVAYILHLRRG